MSIVKEELTHPDIEGMELSILGKTEDESCEDFQIISIEYDNYTTLTPNELIKLGKWFVEQGKRIKKEYTKTGERK